MNVLRTAASLLVESLVLGARWAGRHRLRCLHGAARSRGGSDELVGIELETSTETWEGKQIQLALLEEDTASGGQGGDAGTYAFGVDPETNESTWPASAAGVRAASAPQAFGFSHGVQGARGGSGVFTGGNGGNVMCSLVGETACSGEGTKVT